MDYLTRHFNQSKTSQAHPIPGRNQPPNNAGGYSWNIDHWEQLLRFCTLGSQGGTYYVGERELTVQNAENVLKCIKEDGIRVVDIVTNISVNGQAAKNDSALFVLAACMKLGDLNTKHAAEEALPKVARIGTHIFHFAQYIEMFGGWSELSRRAVRNWYQKMDLSKLVYQVTKYRQRDGWTHRDLLRLTHPKTEGTRDEIYHWITKGWESIGNEPHPDLALRQIWAFELVQRAKAKIDVVSLIMGYRLTREMIPSEWLKDADVWRALLNRMPLTAMMRNLATMTRIGLLKPMSEAARFVCARLSDKDYLRKSRVHPWAILNALDTYSQGTGKARNANIGWHTGGYVSSGPTWEPVPQIVDALDSAFYASFENVEPTGKRFCLGLDVSGSMNHECITTGFRRGPWGIEPIKGMSAAKAAAAVALTIAKTEQNYYCVAFNTKEHRFDISPRRRLDDVTKQLEGLIGGGTDCAVPIRVAMEEKIPVDAFIILTDSETWAGTLHPTQAVQMYRKEMGIDAKLIVVAMAANSCSIADPIDAGQINVVGMDTNLSKIISEFVKS